MLTGLFSASVFALPFSTPASTLTLVSPKLRKRRLLPYAASVVARAYAFKAVEALLDRIGE